MLTILPLLLFPPRPPPAPPPSYEISGALTDISAAIKNLSSWAKTETSPFDFNWFAMRPRAHKLPKGVVLVITPFNYPVWLVVEPLVSIHPCVLAIF